MQREVSIYDLLKFERSRKAIINDNYFEFYDILYELGFDTNKEIDTQDCLHRPLTSNNSVMKGLRWVGEERDDEEWLQSEYCTEDNKIRVLGRKDFEFAKELVEKRKYTNFTQRAMDYMRTGNPEYEFKVSTNKEFEE